MTSPFVLPRTRVLALAVAAALLALVAWQVLGARPASTAGAAVGGVHISMTVTREDGITFKGDSTSARAGAASLITVLAYNYELDNSTTIGSASGGAGAGKAVNKPVTITHVMGASSPEFLAAAASGQHLKSVVINFARTTAQGTDTVYYRVTLTTVFVTAVHQYSSGDNVLEDVSFVFAKIQQQSLTGKTEFIFNVTTGGAV